MAGDARQSAGRGDVNWSDTDGLQFFASEIGGDDTSRLKRIAG
jgi:hypothetical protein